MMRGYYPVGGTGGFSGFEGLGIVLCILFMLLLIAAITAIVFYLVRSAGRYRKDRPAPPARAYPEAAQKHPGALEILDERYARGEISSEEYHRIKSEILGHP